MDLMDAKINNVSIKIVGLLGLYNKETAKHLISKLKKEDKFTEEKEPEKYTNFKNELTDPYYYLKDQYYSEFRELMFKAPKGKNDDDLLSKRFISKEVFDISLLFKRNSEQYELPLQVGYCEIYLFKDQISLFSLKILIPDTNKNISFISDVIDKCRNFDTKTSVLSGDEPILWADWLSQNILVHEKLRGDGVKVDEYSGSKFKVYTVLDAEVPAEKRDFLLYDLGTSSPINTSCTDVALRPHDDYFKEIMKSKVSYFNNWEALCLYDSFTAVGSGLLYRKEDVNTWEYTYFRIYLFRLFFKYNLFRYNLELHDNPIQLRSEFENFLNCYNINHISFNFLPNEIYYKIGKALNLEDELKSFHERISRLSQAIQEENQSRMNALLGIVTVLSFLQYIQTALVVLNSIRSFLGMKVLPFYLLLLFLLALIGILVIAYLKPKRFKTLISKCKKWWR